MENFNVGVTTEEGVEITEEMLKELSNGKGGLDAAEVDFL